MKKIKFIVLLILGAFACVSCGENEDEENIDVITSSYNSHNGGNDTVSLKKDSIICSYTGTLHLNDSINYENKVIDLVCYSDTNACYVVFKGLKFSPNMPEMNVKVPNLTYETIGGKYVISGANVNVGYRLVVKSINANTQGNLISIKSSWTGFMGDFMLRFVGEK